MPLTKKGLKIMGAMTEDYGPAKGKRVFYASENKGTISGVHKKGVGFPSKKRRRKNEEG